MRLDVALGFAPHSGWTAVVAVRLEGGRPSIVYRGRIELSDPSLAGSKQPYHAVAARPLSEAERRLSELSASAERMAKDGLESLTERLRASRWSAGVAGILGSSGRPPKDLASTLRSHALIHNADGEHFRTALQRACEAKAIDVVRVSKSELDPRAAEALGLSIDELQAIVRRAGKPLGPPWGADQKSAALLAWLLLTPRVKLL